MSTDATFQKFVVDKVNTIIGQHQLNMLSFGMRDVEMEAFKGLVEAGLLTFAFTAGPKQMAGFALSTNLLSNRCTGGCGLTVDECINPHHCCEGMEAEDSPELAQAVKVAEPTAMWHEMEDHERSGFAGAEDFDNGKVPLLLYFTIPIIDEFHDCVIVADKNGMQWIDSETSAFQDRQYVSDDVYEEATMLMKLLDDIMSSGQYTGHADLHNILAYLGFHE